MSMPAVTTSPDTAPLTNGPGAAAILAAGFGAFALAVLAIVGDKSPAVRSLLIFYKPTGPLSGVTTLAILIWLLTWRILDYRWRLKMVSAASICIAALTLLGLSVLLTFPPIVDLF
jgi:hypothetical protein